MRRNDAGDGYGVTQPLAALAIDLLFQYGMRQIVIAPGSRSAPLTLAATRHGGMRTRLVYDERSAAYTALGIAQQSGIPVGILCSSGTAALNFAPAIAEAYYQRIPLIALTADRPAEWIDQIDNQAIRQNRLYEPHVRASFVYPVDDGQQETRWHAARIIGDAWSVATNTPAGPVHINIPLREPLYRATTPPIPADAPIRRALSIFHTHRTIDAENLRTLGAIWHNARRKLILVGQHQPDALLDAALLRLLDDPTVVALADVTGNLAHLPAIQRFAHWEGALATQDATALAPLLPDLALWIGGQMTSKAIKSLLRQHPPAHFWRVDPDLPAADAFQSNTALLPLEASHFLRQLAGHVGESSRAGSGDRDNDYAQAWTLATTAAQSTIEKTIDMEGFSEVAAVQQLLRTLPAGSRLQLGNSMPIRLVNLLGIDPVHAPLRIDANRGTSGIDGTVSTAVGAAHVTSELVVLLVGDLGFFYDRNGLWQTPLPANLRIILLNNHGGGIFDVIDGPHTLAAEERTVWFLTPNPLTARRTAEEHGLRYWHAADMPSLEAALPTFFAANDAAADVPGLLEIETDMAGNSKAWKAIQTALRTRFTS